MPSSTDTLDLAPLKLLPGEGRRLERDVSLADLTFGEDTYLAEPSLIPVAIDLSRMTGGGWALRLRFSAALKGPCMRCLEAASPSTSVDTREVDAPGGGEELTSPYVDEDVIDLRAWVRDAFALALPAQVICRPDCAGLCADCGVNLNEHPEHEHERGPDPRWNALREITFD
ncbi:hypothetical protein DSM112329_02240 [Paraconexibacter sp. AEG42_29]|uniref:DUF177 domain-containing protein n=1 Tax=Paraconexibacter sp. AEG42_29 TaxID=2997339 RepID=A0AAU7AUV2_9ACTN